MCLRKYWDLLLFLFLMLLSGSSSLFSQSSYWMQRGGSSTPDEAYDISIDANGNTYTTGYFTGFTTFGTTSLNSSGVTDIFITKLDNIGNYQWTIKGGGPNADRALSIKADAAGNTYVTGFFSGAATFGGQTVTSAGGQDVFIAKYDNTGAIQWVKSAGGSGSDIGNAINIDNSGNVVITGEFAGTANFGSTTLASISNSIDVFTAKLDASGNFLWAKKGSASATDRGIDVACDAAGNVFITGQFSDTIMFDIVHNNTLNNSIFVVKYNSSGQEQWFRRIGAGTMNIVSGIAVDNSSNVLLTGDFTGTVTFFGTPNTTLSNTYSNRVFVAKYDNSGTLLWTHADGSSNNITSKNITIDATGNPYIIGNFKCVLNEYADQYGQGTFNSVGYWDIFVSKYNASGAWQWSRQCGGTDNDYGGGIAVNSNSEAHIAGSFSKKIIFPYHTSFIGYNVDGLGNNYYTYGSYCSDINYHRFTGFNSAGNSDVLIAKNFDLNKAPYDYYIRTGSGCDRPYRGVCINQWTSLNCVDTLTFCGGGQMYALSNIQSPFYSDYDPGPEFSYLWSTGATVDNINVSVSGDYKVTQTSADGCFVSSDTITVIVNPIPDRPTISDDVVVNTDALYPTWLYLCNDSALLTGGGFDTNSYQWYGPTGTFNDTNDLATVTGFYQFVVTNDLGCTNTNTIWVSIDTGQTLIAPKMICLEDIDNNDSLALCKGEMFTMYDYDTITNPLANGNCIPSANTTWSVTPVITMVPTYINCTMQFLPQQSDSYLINAMIVRPSSCGYDTAYLSHTIYVEVQELPTIPDDTLIISGNTAFCPGDSTLFVVTGADFIWHGPGVNGLTDDSLWIHQEGSYFITSTIVVTDSFGCSAQNPSAAYINTVFPPQPSVTMNPPSGLVCPNDSVELTCSGIGSFLWQGPSGTVGGDTAVINVTTPGNYYCILTDTNGCDLVSNTVVVNLYATPYITASPSTVLCEGDSLVLTAIVSPGSTIQWQSPFSGSANEQIVTGPGTYSCSVTACGIPTFANIIITQPIVTAQITADGPLIFCPGNSVTLSGNNSAAGYDWQPGGNNQQTLNVSQAGTYTLTISDVNGCTDSASIAVALHEQADAQFSFTNTCFHDTVLFNNTSQPASANWKWNFGDTIISTTLHPKHVYPDTGTYVVSLVVTTGNGCKDSIYENVEIHSLPEANFSTTNVCNGIPVQFADSSRIDNDTIVYWSWTWGDTTSVGTGQNTSHLYATMGTYNAQLHVTSNAGCIDSITKLIIIHPAPAANFGSSSECFGSATQLNDSSTTLSGSINFWNWNFEDGSPTDVTQNPSHMYVSAGVQSTTLIVENTFGCVDTVTKTVAVYFNPVTNFTFQDVCLKDSVFFNDSSYVDNSAVVNTYLWVFSDGTPTSSFQNPGHYYAGIGTYNVTLISTTNQGCSSAATESVHVFDPPVATFSVDDGCLFDSALFVNTSANPSTGTIGSWSWDYGDGTALDTTLWSPHHLYTSAGNYLVTLIARSSNLGCADTIIDTLTLFPMPLADYTASQVCEGQNTVFNDVSTVSNANTITAWNWTFGDGPANSTQNPIVTYSTYGDYNATLIVSTNNNCKDTITDSVIVHPLPMPAFTSANVCIGSIAQFTDQSTILPISTNDEVFSWNWNFGDGSIVSNNQNTSYLYTNIGTYTVSLKVVSDFGCADSTSRAIVINPNPTVNFTISDTTGCEPLCIDFQDASSVTTGSNIQWSWAAGDGTAFNASSFSHCYNNDSIFAPNLLDVTLTVTSDSGCVSVLTKSDYVTVYPEPMAAFSVLPAASTIVNPVVTITDLSIGTDFWSWNFGDTNTSASPMPPSYTYSDTGAYTIQLITTTNYGCADTSYQTVIIEPEFVFYIPNAFTPNDDGINDTFTGNGIFITDFEMSIFDRWGNLVYHTEEINKPWDGKVKQGKELGLRDTYVYQIKVTDFKSNKHSYKGTVTLVN